MRDGARAIRARILQATAPNAVLDISDGLLILDEQGRIISCEPFSSSFSGEVEHLSDRLIIPGFVDVHSHIPQLDIRGKHGATLLTWLQRFVFPAERSFADLRVVDGVAGRFFKKLILNGTTTSGLYASVHAAATDRCFEIARAAGVRCFIGKVMMDREAPQDLCERVADSLRESADLCAKWHGAEGGRLRYAFTPRFAPACSKELLKGAGRMAQEAGAYLQTHIAETEGENQRVAELFPEYRDYVELLEDCACLGAHVILAHAIHLDEGQLRRIAASSSKIAHCPTSNFFLKSGRMQASLLEQLGIAYGLGTDVGAGTSLSLMTEMRHADYMQLHHFVDPRKAFFLATLGGAQVLSMQDEIGNFAVGKHADFCVIDIAGIDEHYRLEEMDTDEILSLLMYRGNSRAIEATYVAGERLDVDALAL